MKVEELKIGNRVKSCHGYIETIRMILGHEGYKDKEDVHEIYKHLIGVEENGNQYNLAEIKPVLLTDEWLLRAGSEKINVSGWISEGATYWKLNNIVFYEIRGEYFLPVGEALSHQPCITIMFDKVHELQNIFSLTGIELEFKQQ
jgi:hypothetical protein